MDEGAAGTREQNLAPVAGRPDACRTVDIQADIVVAAQSAFASVQSNPHPYPMTAWPVLFSERTLSGYGRHHRPWGRLEDGEEGIAFRADFNSFVIAKRLANDGSVALQHTLIVAAERLEQPGRTLDVGEHEGDRANREMRRHEPIMR